MGEPQNGLGRGTRKRKKRLEAAAITFAIGTSPKGQNRERQIDLRSI
jgi:hypothetical protein